MNGPFKIDPVGLYPLAPFAESLGAQFPIYTTPRCWEDVVRYDPIGTLQTMFEAVARALLSERADQAAIEFRAWIPPQGAQRKPKRVRLSAALYQMTENDDVWIELKKVPERLKPGRLAA